MKTFPYRVAGDAVTIYFPERPEDLDGFREFLARNVGRVLGLDTETTGLHIFGRTFGCRLVQLGDAREAWVLDVERFFDVLKDVLSRGTFAAHNAPFDLLVLDRVGLAALDDLGPRTFDTYVLAHLLDPRTEADGGPGLGLKALSTIYVDPDAADTQKGLDAVFLGMFREWAKTVSKEDVAAWKRLYPKRPHIAWGFTNVAIDHPLYVTYAGLDVIYESRLLAEIGASIKALGLSKLAHWEHAVQMVTTRQMKRGLRVDPVYTARLIEDLAKERVRHTDRAARFGVANVNSVVQIREALLGMGETLTKKTDSGALSVGKDVLLPMADLDARTWDRLGNREPNPVADAVVRAKRASKWAVSYAEPFLDLRDERDHIHPTIKSLAARTARMSVSGPALQQLPSSDWTIRRAIIPSVDGWKIGGIDYKSMELRVLAALADVKEMKRAITEGRDLHDFTTALVYGYDPEEVRARINAGDKTVSTQRRYAKGVGLGKVFGGGAKGLAEQIGAPFTQVKYAVERYDEVYPEVGRYSTRLQREAKFGRNEVVTPFGRHLPVDRDRSYSVVNYAVQSTARDLIAKALLEIENAGLGHHVMLPVHDELIVQGPAEDIEDLVHEIGRHMETVFMGVPIESDPEVYGFSWGAGYMSADDRARLDYRPTQTAA